MRPKQQSNFNVGRTVDTVQRALAKIQPRMRPQSAMNDYVHCRIDPFASSGLAAIPDGSNTNYVTTDSRMFDTLNMNGTAGDFSIQTFPFSPCSAALSGPNTMLVNGYPINLNPGYAQNSSGKYPLSVLPAYLSAPGTLSVLAANNATIPGAFGSTSAPSPTNPYQSPTGRLVAAGYKLSYTGPAFDCSGSVTVTPADISVTESATGLYTGVGVGLVYTIFESDSNAVTTYQVPTGCPVLNVDVSYGTTAMTRDSVVMRPEQGIYFMPRHKTKDFKVRPFFNTVCATVSNLDSANSSPTNVSNMFTSNANATFNTYGGGIVWYDDDWSSAQITVRGANADASFRWDTIWCFEYNPVPSNLVANLTKKRSPDQPSSLAKASQILDHAPIAIPVGMSLANAALQRSGPR
jgi:hypothetical protein